MNVCGRVSLKWDRKTLPDLWLLCASHVSNGEPQSYLKIKNASQIYIFKMVDKPLGAHITFVAAAGLGSRQLRAELLFRGR